VALYFGACWPAQAGFLYVTHCSEAFVKIFDGNYLFNTPVYAPSPYFAVLTAGFVLLTLASIFVYWRRNKLASNPVMRRFIRRVATAGMYYGGLGIFFALMRYGGIDYLAPPFWMYLLFLAMIASIAYYVYDYSENYPVAVHQLEQSKIARKYRPISKQRSGARPVRPRVPAGQRGKRRR
jgi:hypothetical protein